MESVVVCTFLRVSYFNLLVSVIVFLCDAVYCLRYVGCGVVLVVRIS